MEKEGIQELPPARAGEVWFVQLPGELVIDEVYVLHMSDKSCTVRDVFKTHKENRYRVNDVKWIEKSDRVFRR